MSSRDWKLLATLLAALSIPLACPQDARPAPAGSASTNKPTIVFQSAVRRTPLLELFTSEGCSSCPPAEEWLARQRTSAALWKTFVPLAFHVEYWNNDQWQDPWSDKAFGDRQRRYSTLWRRDNVYTPGFVWDGQEWTGWFRAPQLPAAVSEPAGILTVSSRDGHLWRLHFRPSVPLALKAEGVLALMGSGITNEVRGGENAGRRLLHDFAVLRLVQLPLTMQSGTWTGEAKLDLPGKHGASRLAVAAWVAEEHSPRALQATGGWLDRSMARPASVAE